MTKPHYTELLQLIQSVQKEIHDIKRTIADQLSQKEAHSLPSQQHSATKATDNSNLEDTSLHSDISVNSVEIFIPDNPVNQIDLNF